MGQQREPVVQVRDLTYSIGGRPILDRVSLETHRGEVFGVMGMSGSGKSTLLRNIMGLVRPDSGDIRIEGQSIIGLNERELNRVRVKMGMCFQYSALFDSMTVRENVLFGLRERRDISPSELERKCAEHLEIVGLAGTEDQMPAELSGGMRKRVGIARALITQPSIMLYDEPSAGLDPVMAAVIDRLILRLSADFGTTAIVVTHEVDELFGLADRVMMLYEGRAIVCDTPEALRTSDNQVVRQFVEGAAEGPIEV